MHHHLRRFSALAVAALAAGALTICQPGTAHAVVPAAGTPTGTAASWLASQLTNGLIESGYYLNPSDSSSWTTYVDQGQSTDVALSLLALGDTATAKKIADAVGPQVQGWYDVPGYDAPGTIYSGSLAKAIVLGEATGEDLSTWGGGDLVSTLESHVATAAPIDGRVQNGNETSYPSGDPTDSLNVFSQALAARALTNADSDLAPQVTSFLLEQQCGSGGFRLGLTADKTSTDQSCDAADGTPEVDATAYAVLQLEAVPATPAITTAIGKARTWLTGVQLSDGSWREQPGDSSAPANSDSTGLAAQALGGGAAATKAAVWLRRHQAQAVAGLTTKLSPSAGAIAAQDDDWTAGLQNGITQDVAYNWRKATSDAAPALAYLPALGTLAVSTPTFAAPGASVAYTVSGEGEGDAVAATVAGTTVSWTASGAEAKTFTAPTAAGSYQVSVTDSRGRTASATVRVLGPAKPKLKIAKTLHAGKKTTLKVKGLTAGEHVTVKLRGKKVASGTVKATGVFKAKIKLKGKKLTKPGKAKLKVTGQFWNRKVSTTVKVVR